MSSGPVHWHEGLFLQPHHLQSMQHYFLDRFGSERRLDFIFPYGVIDLKLSGDALENMLVRFDRLRVVMPSGVDVNFPESADLPSLDINQAFAASAAAFTVSLALPIWYATRGNTVDPAAGNTGAAGGGAGGAEWRVKRMYKVSEIQCTDENTGENQQPMVLRKLNARLILDEEDHTDLETIPLLRIAHATGQNVGKALQDPAYIPPCMVIGGSTELYRSLRDVATQVQASRSVLVQQISSGGFSIDAMRGVQFEQAMRLRTLNRFAARLGALTNVSVLSQVRPFDFYLDLRELLGELSASHPDRDKEFVVPEYDHDNLAGSFNDLIEKIRSLLGGTVQERYLKIDFILEGAALVLKEPLAQEHFDKPTDYFLGIKTRDDHGALAKLVEDGDKFKLMAKSMIAQRIWGIKLQEERHPPLTLPAKSDLFYYRLMRAESQRMWDRIKDEKMMAVRWPDMQTSDYQLSLYMPIP